MENSNPFDQVAENFVSPDPEKVEAKKQRQAEIDAKAEDARRKANWLQVAAQIGKRYLECRVSNFEITDGKDQKKQQAVVDAVKGFGQHMETAVNIGKNLVLFGPPGTGKDHLLVGLVKRACELGYKVHWERGCDLFSDVRDSYDTKAKESKLIQRYTDPDVLVLSDPLPPKGENLTRNQAVILFQIIDQRYRELKPTWVSMNVSSGEQAGERIGEQTVDRLRDGGLALACDWPSYRRNRKG